MLRKVGTHVVKPPQNPAVKESFNALLKSGLFINNIYKNPRIKLPAIFTTRVEKGKLKLPYFNINKPE